jgi:hypothetical protein
VFAAASVCLALAAHAAGGGGHPPPVAVVLAAVGLAARVCYGLAGRERGLAEMAVGLGAGQVALHLTFTLATLDPAAPTATGPGPGGHSHLAAAPHTAPTMLLAHTLAAAVTVAALRQAERTLWAAAALRSWLAGTGAAVLARFARLLAALGALAPARRPSPARPVVSACLSTACRANVMIARVGRRRGPPGGAARWGRTPERRPRRSPARGAVPRVSFG